MSETLISVCVSVHNEPENLKHTGLFVCWCCWSCLIEASSSAGLYAHCSPLVTVMYSLTDIPMCTTVHIYNSNYPISLQRAVGLPTGWGSWLVSHVRTKYTLQDANRSTSYLWCPNKTSSQHQISELLLNTIYKVWKRRLSGGSHMCYKHLLT